MKLLLFILSFFTSFQLYCQAVEIKGVVVNESNGEALPFANIVVKEKMGLTTDQNGKFQIIDNKLHPSDSIYISYIGYQSYKTTINQLLQNGTIKLKEKSYQLKEVSINAELTTVVPVSFIGPHNINVKRYDQLPNSVRADFLPWSELIMLNPKQKGKLENIKIYITKRGKPKTTFRILLYSVNPKNGKPEKTLLSKNIFVTPKKGNEWLEVDLADQNIFVDTLGFFVGTEIFYSNEEGVYHRRVGGNRIEYYGPEIKKLWGITKQSLEFKGSYKLYVKGNMNNKYEWVDPYSAYPNTQKRRFFPMIVAGIKYF